jgi:cytochrome d ubiquinol oxidase subunit II
MESFFANGTWLPIVFAFLMGLAMLIYAILDGYDLGVGILTPAGTDKEKDTMIASIGPFWDANETWLVLGVGILLVAFPMAHGVILTNLYLPVALMLVGLILRGVAFDFRAKAHVEHKEYWDAAFFLGSLITALAQGHMLGSYILGFSKTYEAALFSTFVGFCVAGGYALIGSSWLIMKAEGELQRKAIRWSRISLWVTAFGILVVSATTPLVSPRIFDKWFSWPEFLFLLPIPLLSGALILFLDRVLAQLPKPNDRHCWVPFAVTVVIFLLCFLGLAYSFFPYIVPQQMTIFEAASAPESLMIILVGALLVLPVFIGYTIFAYRVFWGKARPLNYH